MLKIDREMGKDEAGQIEALKSIVKYYRLL